MVVPCKNSSLVWISVINFLHVYWAFKQHSFACGHRYVFLMTLKKIENVFKLVETENKLKKKKQQPQLSSFTGTCLLFRTLCSGGRGRHSCLRIRKRPAHRRCWCHRNACGTERPTGLRARQVRPGMGEFHNPARKLCALRAENLRVCDFLLNKL